MTRTTCRRATHTWAHVALCIMTLAGCTIEEPQLPTYEAEWIIPLGAIDENLGSLIEGEEDFVIGDDGSISLSAAGQIPAIGVGDRLDVEVDQMSFSAAIGAIDLGTASPLGFAHRLGDLYPAAESLDGTNAIVPAFDFSVASSAQDLPGFRTATVSTGGLEIVITNGLQVPIGAASAPQQLVVGLIDPTDQSQLGSFVVASAIAAGGSYQHRIDLAGLVLPDRIGVAISGGSTGSGGQTVTVDADRQLSVSVRTAELEVETADAVVGAQSFLQTARLVLPDSVRVHEATISSGNLALNLRNDLPVGANLELEIPQFVNAQNAPLIVQIPLPAGSNVLRNVDLQPYGLRLGTTGEQALDLVARVSTPGSNGAYVAIDSADSVTILVEPLLMRFSRVTGILDPVSVDIGVSSTSLVIPEDLEHMQLESAELMLGFRSTLGLPVHVDLRLEGTNDAGVTVPMETSFEVPAYQPNGTTEHSRILDRANSSIVEFLNNLPTTITFSGTARVGDGVSVGSVAVTDSIAARWSVSAPMVVALSPQTIDTEPRTIEMSEEVRRNLQERLVELTIEAEVTSTLPLAAVATVGVDADAADVFGAPTLQLGPINIPAASGEGSSSQRVPTVVSSRVIVPAESLPLITQPGAWHGLRVSIPGTAGQFITLRATDSVQVRGFLRARVFIGEVE